MKLHPGIISLAELLGRLEASIKSSEHAIPSLIDPCTSEEYRVLSHLSIQKVKILRDSYASF